jgi:hypothetical protein
MDFVIDIERLRSIDGFVTEKIREHTAAANDLRFYTGPFRLGDKGADRPGSRMIYLSQSSKPDSYFDLDKTELWNAAPASAEFTPLMDFIATLPFKSTGRILIMYDDVNRPVTPHRDHTDTDVCHEFIWFRTNLRKPFYLLNADTQKKLYVTSHSAWFDTVNQFHGSEGAPGLTFSIRVDGVFTDDFRRLIPTCAQNRAATPALWATETECVR